ncbi:MAG TPA: DNA primase, partial [Candidatus Moranbacteria bacterium]|nr:DNA primase [Candidatus Moranbacteria bacterium]
MSEIEEIKSRLNIVDIVGETVPLSSAGAGRYKGLCPFHKEKTPSFVVDGEKQLWHCFGCSRGGDLFSFLMERDGLDFYQVLQTLAERAGVELSGRSGSAASGAEDKVFLRKITAAAADFYAET